MIVDAHSLKCFLERFIPEEVKHNGGFGLDGIPWPDNYGVSLLVYASKFAFRFVGKNNRQERRRRRGQFLERFCRRKHEKAVSGVLDRRLLVFKHAIKKG